MAEEQLGLDPNRLMARGLSMDQSQIQKVEGAPHAQHMNAIDIVDYVPAAAAAYPGETGSDATPAVVTQELMQRLHSSRKRPGPEEREREESLLIDVDRNAGRSGAGELAKLR